MSWMKPWIRATELTKKYGKTIALDSLSFSIGEGVTLLYGPNGAGKSTLVSILEGLTMRTDGQVLVEEIDPARRPETLMSKVGFLPERPVIFGGSIVADFFHWYLKLSGSDLSRCRRLVDAFSAGYLLEHKFNSLSLGEMQLVNLVAVLSLERDGYVMDEPNANLDFHQRRVLSREISLLRAAGKNLLISTHIVDELVEVVDRSIGLNKGKIALLSEGGENSRGGLFSVNIISTDSELLMNALSSYSPRILDGRIVIDGAKTGEVLNSLSESERLAVSSVYLTPRMDIFE